jgi:hypothetical protein
MAAPLDLPTEVFTQIFSLIPRDQLTSCALVSRSWYAQATSILYQTIDLTWSRPTKICDQSGDNMHPDPCPCEQGGKCMPEQHDSVDSTVEWWERRHLNMAPCLLQLSCTSEKWPLLFALTKTLVYSPSLARLVRHLRLTGPVPRSVWTTPQRTSLSRNECRRIESILPFGSYMSKTGWLRRLDNGCPHAFAALLLVCIPDLRSLELGPQFQDSLQILGRRTLVRTLQHLDVAAVGITQTTVWMGSGRAPFPQSDDFPQLLLLHLVGIRSLTLNLPRPRNFDLSSHIDCGTLMTFLETLELAFTFIDEYDLGHLLRICPRLQTLKYDYWTQPATRDPHGLQGARYIPDRFSERLVQTQVLQSSLNVVQRTLVTLHIHIVKPWDLCNQNLRGIDFSQFESLIELHAPLQLLVSKHSSISLADSLPTSLRYLWLNDDATRLWLNHDYFMSPQDFDVEGQVNPVDNPLWHPIYTDREVVEIMLPFLSDWRTHVPDLQVLKMLFDHVHCASRRPRNIHYLRRVLEPAGRMADVHTTVTLLNGRYGSGNGGRVPPYFSEERIVERLCHNCDRLTGTMRIYDSDTDE